MKFLKVGFLLCFLILFLSSWFLFGKTLKQGAIFFFNFLKPPAENLLYKDGRTNVLLLGMAGGKQPGSDLTDTLIFVSLDIKNGDMVLLSLPRDIWSTTLKAKINTAYHYGREKGEGLLLAKQVVEEIVAQPIHYTFLLDFQGFVRTIDLLGGIRVKVDRSFDDYQYPIAGKENDLCNGDPKLQCRYEHLHFEAGWQEMDGQTALKFVRSRNAKGEEGTDFARSQRQQKVLTALKEKIISPQILTNLEKIKNLLEIPKIYLKSEPSLNDAELAAFTNLLWRFLWQQSTLRTLTLDTGSEENPGFLINPPISSQYQNQWVLLPRSGNWQEFQNYFKQKLNNGY